MEDIEENVLMNQILQNVVEAENEDMERRSRRQFQRLNAFQLPDHSFKKLFRLSKDMTNDLIGEISPFTVDPSRSSALSTRSKLLVALRFFATGSYQEITGTNLYTAVSQSSVSKCIDEIINVFNLPEIFNRYVSFPNTINELTQIRNRYMQKFNFPGIIGIVDGTHIAIVPPSGEYEEHIFVNRKNYHSINVQVICDDTLKIRNINATFPGSSHDAYVWRQSTVSRVLEDLYRNHEDLFYVLGDSGYPLRPWLMTPIRNVVPGSPEDRYNTTFKTVRSNVERCIGILKNRWRCLLKHRVLHYNPQKAAKIVNTCAVLHNFCITRNLHLEDEDYEEENMADVLREERLDGRDLLAGRNIQNNIVRNYFV